MFNQKVGGDDSEQAVNGYEVRMKWSPPTPGSLENVWSILVKIPVVKKIAETHDNNNTKQY